MGSEKGREIEGQGLTMAMSSYNIVASGSVLLGLATARLLTSARSRSCALRLSLESPDVTRMWC